MLLIFRVKVYVQCKYLQNFAHPRHDEWNKFLYTTQELRNQVEEDIEKKDPMRMYLHAP